MRRRSLGDSVYLDIVAYILQVNGHAAGAEALRADSAVAIAPGAPGSGHGDVRAGGRPLAPPSGGPVELVNRVVASYSPVTDELLENPPDQEWLSWRRTPNGHGYSPLDQITPGNVGELRIAWVWAMEAGRVQTAPLVHDGVLFLANPGNVLQALDARTGDIIWQYRREYPDGRRSNLMRSIALYQDKVYMTTADLSVVAVDARTGELVWQTKKADEADGFYHTAGPVIADGVVISGITGCGQFTQAGCFITGHDSETGAELWRTSTIAQPGEPGGDTWGDLPRGVRGGAETWIPGTYDPDLDLYFVGTAQAKPWAAVSRGLTTADAVLYSNSTLALDPRSGEIVWYFQHVPGESLDLDTVFERVLIDVDDERLLFTVGKDGLLWKLARDDGAYLGVRETVFQNVFESIDTATGRVTYRPDIIDMQIGQPILSCPAYYGGHNWPASAYSPETSALIVPLIQNHCSEMAARSIEAGGRLGFVHRVGRPLLPAGGRQRHLRAPQRLRRQDPRRAVESRAAGVVLHRRRHDRLGPGVRRRRRPLLHGVRRADGRGSLAHAPGQLGVGLCNHLRARRPAIRSRADRDRSLHQRPALREPGRLRTQQRRGALRLSALPERQE